MAVFFVKKFASKVKKCVMFAYHRFKPRFTLVYITVDSSHKSEVYYVTRLWGEDKASEFGKIR